MTMSNQSLSLTDVDLVDFATGAAFLGAGGGGDPYIGRLLCQAAIREFGHPRIIDVNDFPDDALVAFVALVGAPTVVVEKAVAGPDIDLVLERLSQRLGRPLDALMPAEIGGVNSTLPIVAAARSGLPLLNVDGMGRAFPEIQMVVMNFEGLSATPFVVVDEHKNAITIDTDSAIKAEEFVRSIAMQMGLSCVVAGYPMTGAQAKRATVHNTMTEALQIGRAIRAGRKAGDPVGALIEALSSSVAYGFACELFDGKIIDLQRTTEGGFAVGHCRLESIDGGSRAMEIVFQNENLIARENGDLRAVVPDLITVVDRESAEPIPTEALRYGQRVRVIATAAPAAIKTPQALKFVSPRCFKLDVDFTPVQQLNVGA